MNKQLRLVSRAGKIRLVYCWCDEDDFVERVTTDSFEDKWRNMDEFKAFLAEVNNASRKAITVVTAANRNELMCVDLEG